MEATVEWAFLLDGQGGARELEGDEVGQWKPADGVLWVHFNYAEADTKDWLRTASGVPEVYQEALTDESPRPRVLAVQDHLLVVLRGINRNHGHNPEDMVALRLWAGAERVITLRNRPVMALRELRTRLEEGGGPRDSGEFLTRVVDALVERISDTIEELVDRVDGCEEKILEQFSPDLRGVVGALRREAITLRRHIAPQRDAVFRLTTERVSWLSDLHRAALREEADRATRIVEDLDAARDRSVLIQEQITGVLGEQMNRIMYFLSIVTAIFLPLGLLTGLFGINVGGMPGTDSPWAFTVVTVSLVLLAIFLLFVFRWLRLV